MKHTGIEKRLYNRSTAPAAAAAASDGFSTASHAYDPHLPCVSLVSIRGSKQPRGGRRRMVRNKAKRRARYPTIPRFPVYYYSTIPVRCLVRQTNPICGRSKGRITAAEEKSYEKRCWLCTREKQSQTEPIWRAVARAEPAPAQAGDTREPTATRGQCYSWALLAARHEMHQTKPIWNECDKRQVLGGERIMVNLPREQPRKNKANWAEGGGLSCACETLRHRHPFDKLRADC